LRGVSASRFTATTTALGAIAQKLSKDEDMPMIQAISSTNTHWLTDTERTAEAVNGARGKRLIYRQPSPLAA
jgi:hypothetical protein